MAERYNKNKLHEIRYTEVFKVADGKTRDAKIP